MHSTATAADELEMRTARDLQRQLGSLIERELKLRTPRGPFQSQGFDWGSVGGGGGGGSYTGRGFQPSRVKGMPIPLLLYFLRRSSECLVY
ncbi:hypothetical protein WAI453_006035 [Rhynchosporium graminicola]